MQECRFKFDTGCGDSFMDSRLYQGMVDLARKRFKGLKACLWWKVHFAYPASLQAIHSNT